MESLRHSVAGKYAAAVLGWPGLRPDPATQQAHNCLWSNRNCGRQIAHRHLMTQSNRRGQTIPPARSLNRGAPLSLALALPWKVMRSIVLKSKPLDIREGRRAEALESTPPPSPPDVEVQSERSTDGNRMRSSPRASLPRELRRLSFPIPIYGQDTSQRASGRASERVSTHQM